MMRRLTLQGIAGIAGLWFAVSCGGGSDSPSAGAGGSEATASASGTGGSAASTGPTASSSSSSSGGVVGPDPKVYPGVDFGAVPEGKAAEGCEGGFDALTGLLALTLSASDHGVRLGVVMDEVQVNGVTCTAKNGDPAKLTSLKHVTIQGSSADDVIVIDASTQAFGSALTKASGIDVDGGGGKDTLAILGSAEKDAITLGATGVDLDGDALVDVRAKAMSAFAVSAGPGDDVVSAAGSAETGGALATAIAIYGGAGADAIEGTSLGDVLDGGEGDDSFVASATMDGADTLRGGAGHDTVDYRLRTAALAVTLCLSPGNGGSGPCASDDGEAGEHDAIEDIEKVLAGSGDDKLTGAASDDDLDGGEGKDVLHGGDGADSLSGGAGDDQLFGEAGDDTLQDAAGTNTLEGGAGDGDICFGTPADTLVGCELM